MITPQDTPRYFRKPTGYPQSTSKQLRCQVETKDTVLSLDKATRCTWKSDLVLQLFGRLSPCIMQQGKKSKSPFTLLGKCTGVTCMWTKHYHVAIKAALYCKTILVNHICTLWHSPPPFWKQSLKFLGGGES